MALRRSGGLLVRRTVRRSMLVRGRLGVRLLALTARPGCRFYTHRTSGLRNDGYRKQPVLLPGRFRRM